MKESILSLSLFDLLPEVIRNINKTVPLYLKIVNSNAQKTLQVLTYLSCPDDMVCYLRNVRICLPVLTVGNIDQIIRHYYA